MTSVSEPLVDNSAFDGEALDGVGAGECPGHRPQNRVLGTQLADRPPHVLTHVVPLHSADGLHQR